MRLKSRPSRGRKHRAGTPNGFTLLEILIVVSIFTTSVIIMTDVFVLATRTQRRQAVVQKVHSDIRFALETIAREARLGQIDYDAYRSASGSGDLYGNGLVDKDIREGPVENLIIKDGSGQSLFFRAENVTDPSQSCQTPGIVCQAVTYVNDDYPYAYSGGTSVPQVLTSSDTRITNLSFYIWPDNDPYLVRSCINDTDCQAFFDDGTSENGTEGICDTEANICRFGVADAGLPSGIAYHDTHQPRVTIIIEGEDTDPTEAVHIAVQTSVSLRFYP